MVSAAAGNKKAFGIDRAANPWPTCSAPRWSGSAAPTSPSARRSPPTTSGRRASTGRQVIVVDPRITPIARTCDLFLPIKPGRDAALFNGILHLMIEHDWLDHDFIDDHTVGLRDGRRARARLDARAHRAGHRHRRARDPPGRGMVGHGADQLPPARARHRALEPRRAERARRDQHRAGVGADRPAESAATRPSPARATARAAASTARSATSSRAARDLANPEHRAHVAGVWGIDPDDLPQPASTPTRSFRKIDRRRDPRPAQSICFNPVVSLPDNDFVRAHARAARVLRRHRLLPERDRALRRRRAARLAAGGGRGHRHHRRGARRSRSTRRSPARARRARTGASSRTSPGRSAASTASRSRRRARSSTSCARPRKGGVADYSGITYETIEREHGVFWPCPSGGPSRHAAPLRARLLEPGGPGRGAVLLPRRQGALQRRRLHAARRGRRRRVPAHPHHRPRGQPVPLRATRPGASARWSTTTRSRASRCTRRWPERLGIADGDWATVETRRGALTLPRPVVATIRPDTIFIPYHWPGGAERQPAHHRGPGSDLEDSRVQGVRRAARDAG